MEISLEVAVKKQSKQLKQKRKQKPFSWLVRADRRRGMAIAKLPTGCSK